MTLRSDAIQWLSTRGFTDGHVVTSKRYAPEESWTREKAWWLQIPVRAIIAGTPIDIICETEPGSGAFHHLRVPAAFFSAHLTDFAMIGQDKINLFLAAEPGNEFVDQRGPARLSLAQFRQL